MSTHAISAYIERLSRRGPADPNLWLAPDRQIVGRFMRCFLSSAYQPIVDFNRGELIGHEAFVRSYDRADSALSPWSLFALAAADQDLVGLDRLCRTVHTLNHFAVRDDARLLFLNVHGRLLAAVADDHGHAFRRVVESIEVDTRQIVIEIPEFNDEDLPLLAFVLANYRLNGFQVSLTVSRAPRILSLVEQVRPDFIKLDARHPLSQEETAQLLDATAAHGIPLIFQRVESHERLASLQEAGASLIQGHVVGRPQAHFVPLEAANEQDFPRRLTIEQGIRASGGGQLR